MFRYLWYHGVLLQLLSSLWHGRFFVRVFEAYGIVEFIQQHAPAAFMWRHRVGAFCAWCRAVHWWFIEQRVRFGFAQGRLFVDGDLACVAKTGSVARRFSTSRAGRVIFDGGSSGGSTKLGKDCGRGDLRRSWSQRVQSVAVDVETWWKRSAITGSRCEVAGCACCSLNLAASLPRFEKS